MNLFGLFTVAPVQVGLVVVVFVAFVLYKKKDAILASLRKPEAKILDVQDFAAPLQQPMTWDVAAPVISAEDGFRALLLLRRRMKKVGKTDEEVNAMTDPLAPLLLRDEVQA